MKTVLSILRTVVFFVFGAVITSCGHKGYQDLPFGGMKGRVQKVTVIHRSPEVWHVNEKGTDVLYMEALAYDINGYEICSARMDTAGVIEVEAESMFENGLCVRSTQKVGGRVIARLNLVSEDKGVLEYSREIAGHTSRMTIKKSSFMRRHKTEVSEDGKITSINEIKTDRQGYPVTVKDIDPETGAEILQFNEYDENHNITEKRVKMDGEEKDQVISTVYSRFDDHGNWIEARTYNRNNLPVEILQREIEYW